MYTRTYMYVYYPVRMLCSKYLLYETYKLVQYAWRLHYLIKFPANQGEDTHTVDKEKH